MTARRSFLSLTGLTLGLAGGLTGLSRIQLPTVVDTAVADGEIFTGAHISNTDKIGFEVDLSADSFDWDMGIVFTAPDGETLDKDDSIGGRLTVFDRPEEKGNYHATAVKRGAELETLRVRWYRDEATDRLQIEATVINR